MPDVAAIPIAPPEPSRVGRLLAMVRKLIDYGRELAATLRQPSTADLRPIAGGFGTWDIALIVARITRGLLLAGALEDRLLRSGARLDAPRKSRVTPAPAKPASAARTPPPAHPDTRLDQLPTAEQIAADIRRRPIGGVIADICRDLGIRPNHPLWRELQSLIMRHGGNLTRLVMDILDRVVPFCLLEPAGPPEPSAIGTGPP